MGNSKLGTITFRKLEKDDVNDRIIWFNNDSVNKYLGQSLQEGTTYEKQIDWFHEYNKDKTKSIFVIEIDGRAVGNVGLTDISDLNAGLFIVIGETDLWRKGIGSEAIKFIVDFGFNKIKLHKIWLTVCEKNVNAIRLYEKCGFRKVGLLKGIYVIDGKSYDEVLMEKLN